MKKVENVFCAQRFVLLMMWWCFNPSQSTTSIFSTRVSIWKNWSPTFIEFLRRTSLPTPVLFCWCEIIYRLKNIFSFDRNITSKNSYCAISIERDWKKNLWNYYLSSYTIVEVACDCGRIELSYWLSTKIYQPRWIMRKNINFISAPLPPDCSTKYTCGKSLMTPRSDSSSKIKLKKKN